MKKNYFFLLAGIIALAVVILIPSCKEEIYTDEEALAAMKEGLKYKNDLAKELAALQLTNEMQLLNLQSQLSMKEMKAADSLSRIGAKTVLSISVRDVTGSTTDLSGFSISVNQSGVMKTLTTDANGLTVFPDCITGSASFVVTKTGFVRTSGLVNIYGADWDKETTQQSIFVPVFPTNAATSKISGVLTAQLDALTEEKELLKGGVVSLNFNNIWDIIDDPNSNLDPMFGIIGIVYDGGFMQSIKTLADGKYEFKIPKTKNDIYYILTVSTIQKKQKLLFGDYPVKLDSMRVDSFPTYFGYYPGSTSPVWDNIGYYYYNSNLAEFPGVNLKISAPAGGQKPTVPAYIFWDHNDSTVVNWSYSSIGYYYMTEWTRITQAPVFVYKPYDASKVTVVTPTTVVPDIVNGKLISVTLANGGSYKEYGRKFPGGSINTLGTVSPTQATPLNLKFFEQLANDDQVNWPTTITYQTALATANAPTLVGSSVQVTFTVNRSGKGYTAKPNAELILRIQTPGTGTGDTGDAGTDSTFTYNLGVNLTSTGVASLDPLVLPSTVKRINQVHLIQGPIISTAKWNNSTWLQQGSNGNLYLSTTLSYNVDLTNGLKIIDAGAGYKTAPKVIIKASARKKGNTGSYVYQTVAEATTTIDADGRIKSLGDPVMLDKFEFEYQTYSAGPFPTYPFLSWPQASVPTEVNGLTQAYARAMVDQWGTITSVLLYNEESTATNKWYTSAYLGGNYASGRGYTTIPTIKITPVGKTSVEIPAQLRAEISSGRISNIYIDNGGKGYTIRNNPKALLFPDYLNKWIYTNGSSDIVYNIDLGSGWHGDPVDIFID